jgi:hypothetical protein
VRKRLEKHQHRVAWPLFPQSLDARQAGARRRGGGVIRRLRVKWRSGNSHRQEQNDFSKVHGTTLSSLSVRGMSKLRQR